MAWRIEQAKTDRSSCRQCGQRIAKGEHRFGNDDLNALWYHLGCAEAGKPRAFKPFATKAAALMAKTPAAPKPAAKKPKAAAGRDADLEARLIANPDDDTLAVFADALQSNGDPWGELIALELAGKEQAAKKILKANLDSLVGSFAPRMFEWRRGFIDRIGLEPRASRSVQQDTLDKTLGLRTAVLVRELGIPLKLDDDFVAFLNRRVPPTVKKIFTWLVNPIGKLALPNLERLDLYGLREETPDAAALAPLFSGKQLPKLKRLDIANRPLPIPVLAALLDSPIVKQLEWLELSQNALDDEGVKFVKQRKTQLASVAVLKIDGAHDTFKKQFDAWLERANDEP
jgi:uncharacterized protein (TIGR02996 family)